MDFALAYYLGRKAVTDPTAFFHIVSKDKGYDPLIEHLKARRVKVCRHDNFVAVINALQSPKPTAPSAAKVLKRRVELRAELPALIEAPLHR